MHWHFNREKITDSVRFRWDSMRQTTTLINQFPRRWTFLISNGKKTEKERNNPSKLACSTSRSGKLNAGAELRQWTRKGFLCIDRRHERHIDGFLHRQQGADLLVQVAEEIDIRRSAEHVPVLSKRVEEQLLKLVPLADDYQLAEWTDKRSVLLGVMFIFGGFKIF